MFINEINPDLIEKISTEEIENEALERLRTIFLNLSQKIIIKI